MMPQQTTCLDLPVVTERLIQHQIAIFHVPTKWDLMTMSSSSAASFGVKLQGPLEDDEGVFWSPPRVPEAF